MRVQRTKSTIEQFSHPPGFEEKFDGGLDDTLLVQVSLQMHLHVMFVLYGERLKSGMPFFFGCHLCCTMRVHFAKRLRARIQLQEVSKDLMQFGMSKMDKLEFDLDLSDDESDDSGNAAFSSAYSPFLHSYFFLFGHQ